MKKVYCLNCNYLKYEDKIGNYMSNGFVTGNFNYQDAYCYLGREYFVNNKYIGINISCKPKNKLGLLNNKNGNCKYYKVREAQ